MLCLIASGGVIACAGNSALAQAASELYQLVIAAMRKLHSVTAARAALMPVALRQLCEYYRYSSTQCGIS